MSKNRTKEQILEEIKNIVTSKSAKIIDISNYKNNESKFWLECKEGHKFDISFGNLSKGKWCAYCSKNKKLNIEFAQNIAKKFEATLLSTEYKNVATKMHWRCKYGHEFWMKINAINSKGTWCPYCASWSSEEICRAYFEQIFEQKFHKIRPEWLRNSRNNKMELDGISENMIDGCYVAFEHQGEQHYKKSENMSKSNRMFDFDLVQRKLDDEMKVKLCNENNVLLIQIPQLFKMTLIHKLKALIEEKCENIINISNFDFSKEINYSKIYIENADNARLFDKAKKIIENNGGKCLSDKYINSILPLNIQCNEGHVFKCSLNGIECGRWCADCCKVNNKKKWFNKTIKTLNDHNIICTSNFTLKSTDSVSKFKLNWLCKNCGYSGECVLRQLVITNFKCQGCITKLNEANDA